MGFAILPFGEGSRAVSYMPTQLSFQLTVFNIEFITISSKLVPNSSCPNELATASMIVINSI